MTIQRDRSLLWAITCYFNPIGYQRKRENYRLFRRWLKVPLVVVELSYDGKFDLQPEEAEILIQLQGRDILWQKERLLNLALQAVPKPIDRIAWIDSDVIFADRDWSAMASQLLETEANVVHLFSRLHHLPKDLSPPEIAPATLADITPLFSEESFGMKASSGANIGNIFRTKNQSSCSMGVAWAARREILTKHGFYDACIIGGGDTTMAFAALGEFDRPIRSHQMNAAQARYYLNWADPYFQTVRGKIAYVNCDLFHLWHGDITHRRYQQRHQDLRKFQFDPAADISIDEAGCWQWNTAKPDLHDYVQRYFSMRNEDGSA